jgi:hypothetical protein
VRFVIAALILSVAATASAWEWAEVASRAGHFMANTPGEPTAIGIT